MTSTTEAQHVRILGVLSLVIGGFLALASLATVAVASLVAIVPADGASRALVLFAVLFAALLAVASLWLVAGFGLVRLRPWARPLGLLVSVLSLLAFPLGTAFGAYGLWVLTRPGLATVLRAPPASPSA